jgi:DMSO reductase anchor subunit
MHPAWSVILFTTLAGAGQGLFLALVAAEFLGALPQRFSVMGASLAFALCAAGLVASTFHLGRPSRGWRAASRWRTSWLSREVIVLPLFLASIAAWGAAHALSLPTHALGAAGALLAGALFLCTGMIYACLPFLQEWRTPLTVVNFAALGTASGLTAAALLAAWRHPQLAQPYAMAALAVGALGYATRLASLARNARLRPKSTPSTAIGVRHPKIVQIAQGAMGGSFNTREFFHGRPHEVVRAFRATFLVLTFPLPALLILVAGGSPALLALALAVQFAGLLAERWYFFAEARHPQNLYYRAIA